MAYRTGRPTKLTHELAEVIIRRIRAGAFPGTAAASCGVSPRTYYRWLRQGRGRGARRKFRQFRQQVMQAAAEAIAVREIRIATEDPLTWLRLGPGKADWGNKATITFETLPSKSATPAPFFSLLSAYHVLQEMGFLPRNDPAGESLVAGLTTASDDASLLGVVSP